MLLMTVLAWPTVSTIALDFLSSIPVPLPRVFIC